MGLFLECARAKLGMADALRTVIDSGGNPYSDIRRMMLEAIRRSWKQASTTVQSSPTSTNPTILAAFTGIALSVGRPEQHNQARRLIDLNVAGLTVA